MKKWVLFIVGLYCFAAAATCDRSTSAGQPCIDEALIDPDRVCTMEYEPVCGCDSVTYSNACEARKAGVTRWTEGPCASPP